MDSSRACLLGSLKSPLMLRMKWRRLSRYGEVNPQLWPGANGLWKPMANDGAGLQIVFEHSKEFPFSRSLQFIRPDPSGSAIDFRFMAEARRDVSLPFGHHVLLRWPVAPARIFLDAAPFAFGLTYLGAVATCSPTTSPGRSFRRLCEVTSPTPEVSI